MLNHHIEICSFQETVVHASNCLAITSLRVAGGSFNKQSIEFVKACVTFNGITIPSISSIIPRIHLFLETAEVRFLARIWDCFLLGKYMRGRVCKNRFLILFVMQAAFMNGLLSHTEDLIKTALKCLQDSSISDGNSTPFVLKWTDILICLGQL